MMCCLNSGDGIDVFHQLHISISVQQDVFQNDLNLENFTAMLDALAGKTPILTPKETLQFTDVDLLYQQSLIKKEPLVQLSVKYDLIHTSVKLQTALLPIA